MYMNMNVNMNGNMNTEHDDDYDDPDYIRSVNTRTQIGNVNSAVSSNRQIIASVIVIVIAIVVVIVIMVESYSVISNHVK